jgi:hypothetical protein
MTDADLLDALRDCYVATMQRNVVYLRLVRSATLAHDTDAPGASIPGLPPRYIAHVTLTAPGNDEAANAQLKALIENRLLGLPSVSTAHITLLPPLFSIL